MGRTLAALVAFQRIPGINRTECEIADSDFTAELLASVSFVAVIADVCRQIHVSALLNVRGALGEEESEPQPAA